MLKLLFTSSDIISIHALREEGDAATAAFARFAIYFYPRPPRGGRRRGQGLTYRDFEFLSTPSARRATTARRLDPREVIKFLSTPSARRAT